MDISNLNLNKLRVDQLKNLITILHQQSKLTKINLDLLQTKNENLSRELEKTKKRTRQSLKTSFKQISNLKYKALQYDNIVSRNESLSNKIQKIKEKNEKLKAKDRNIEAHVYNRFKQQVEENLKSESDLRNKVDELRSEIFNQEKTKKNEIKDLKLLIKEIKEENLKLREKKFSIKNQHKKKAEEMKVIIEQLKQEKNEISKQLNQKEKQFGHFVSQQEKMEETVKRKVLILINQRNSLEKNLKILTQEKDNNSNFTNLANQIELITKENVSQKQHLNNYQLKLAQIENDHKKEIQEIYINNKQQIDNLINQQEKQTKQQKKKLIPVEKFEKKIKELKQMNKNFRIEVTNLQKQKTEYSGHIRQVEKEKKSLEEEIEKIKTENDKLKNENINLTGQFLEQQSELLVLKNENQEKTRIKNNLILSKKLGLGLKHETFRFQMSSQLLSVKNKELEGENKNLRKQIRKINLMNIELTSRILMNEKEYNKLLSFAKNMKKKINLQTNHSTPPPVLASNKTILIHKKKKNVKNINNRIKQTKNEKIQSFQDNIENLFESKIKIRENKKEQEQEKKKEHEHEQEQEQEHEQELKQEQMKYFLKNKMIIGEINNLSEENEKLLKQNRKLINEKNQYMIETKLEKMRSDQAFIEISENSMHYEEKIELLHKRIQLIQNIKPVKPQTLSSNKTLKIIQQLLNSERKGKIYDQRILHLYDEQTLIVEKEKIGVAIQAGNKAQLLKLLILPYSYTQDYHTQFLFTFRRYIKAKKVLEALTSGFTNSLNQKIIPRPSEQELVQSNIVKVCLLWVKYFFNDFKKDNELAAIMGDLLIIIQTTQFKTIKNIANTVQNQFNLKLKNKSNLNNEQKRQRQNGKRKNERNEGSESKKIIEIDTKEEKNSAILILKKSITNWKVVKIFDLNEIELAKQLTLVEMDLFKKVEVSEMLNKRWSKKDKNLTPNLINMIERFNEISLWIISSILSYPKKKMRSYIITKFIKCGKYCIDIGNFNTAMEINAGLNNSSIRRLEKSWDLVKQKHIENFENLAALLSSRKNSINLRNKLESFNNKPRLPYIGMFLSDLTFIEDGNKDYSYNKLINFQKCSLLSNVILKIINCQEQNYDFKPNFEIQKYLSNLKYETDEEKNYKKSLRLEQN
ncbi:guanine nucleotide exchange factor [Anaeramoeba flamelloides]|uniref:Guanine nucleotide exchange factor n=1 Tax=Anaeramoeba flamelloides TaxID=1746091 RepID=A0AAV7ZUS0_9EUKA|nr:guanine nucleotide exchange factor [Anaeramoeba flamelloides]